MERERNYMHSHKDWDNDDYRAPGDWGRERHWPLHEPQVLQTFKLKYITDRSLNSLKKIHRFFFVRASFTHINLFLLKFLTVII